MEDARESIEERNFVVWYFIYDNKTATYVAQPPSIIPPPNGAGSIISNVHDYTKWIRTFLHPENTSSPISMQAVDDMNRPYMVMPQSLPPSSPMTVTTRAYGRGLQTGVYRGHKVVSYGGAISGWMTEMAWLPDLDWGIGVMQNTYTFAFEIVVWKLLDHFLGTPENERFDMPSEARAMEREATEKFANARERLYLDAQKLAATGLALPLQAYEGTYSHPAYHGINLSMPFSHEIESLPGAPLTLHATPVQKSYLKMAAIFHHVSGEYWYMRTIIGPGSWLADEIMKAKFDIGVDGKVERLGLQAETAIEQWAWFDKIT